MRNFVPDLIICFIVVCAIVVCRLVANILHSSLSGDVSTQLDDAELTISQLIERKSKDYSWMLRLSVNCFGYLCILVPGFLIYKYTNKINYLDRYERSTLWNLVRLCLSGSTDGADRIDLYTRSGSGGDSLKHGSKSSVQQCILLGYCFIGLMGSYLTWGVLQEKIMTQTYINSANQKTKFKDSQFLVFTNRILGFLITAIYLSAKNQLFHKTPLYKYSFASFSNIMSAWFQYEALKFVNFPTQVLAKSCKIIPVMIMGKIISRTKYEFYEYVTAVLISIGMVFFLTGSMDESKSTAITTLTGVLLLVLYMVFDSFTSNWQSELFKKYSMSSIQMMCGVNLFSSLFTATSLTIQGGFYASIQFALDHPKFIIDCVILSISSAVGQLFIFYTIAKFGAVVFTIIMTVRQAIAILISCLIYHHSISSLGIIGVIIVFLAIFLRVYCNQRLKSLKRQRTTRTTVSLNTKDSNPNRDGSNELLLNSRLNV
uniref:Adenosine 3'-phospho 5'-phosphosulfate transporter 1 n=1 Tax=Corethrella appendiculata TaxID=1370023 RepID=U5ETI1_9DIPT